MNIGLNFWRTTKLNRFLFKVNMVIDLITEWNYLVFFLGFWFRVYMVIGHWPHNWVKSFRLFRILGNGKEFWESFDWCSENIFTFFTIKFLPIIISFQNSFSLASQEKKKYYVEN